MVSAPYYNWREKQWRLRKDGRRPAFSLSHQSLLFSWISPNPVLVMSDISCDVTTNEFCKGTGWMTMQTVATLRSASPEKRFPTSMPSRWACLTHIQHTSCPIGIWRKKFLNTEDDENHFPLFRKPGISASMEAEMNWKVSRCKSETTLQWTRPTAYWCEPMIRCLQLSQYKVQKQN